MGEERTHWGSGMRIGEINVACWLDMGNEIGMPMAC